MLGTRDYCRKNGFTDVVIGLVGRHRLDARRGASPSTRSAPTTSTASRCRRATRATTPSPTPRRSPTTSGSTTARSRSSRRSRAFLDMLGAELRRATAGPDAGEPAEPLPRPGADGAVERVRLDGAHDRQQERDGRRLLHDLRRLGRRLRGDQGRAEDRGVRRSAATSTSGPAGRSIPEAVLTKPPSAELRPDQRDDQSLPPYDVLDPILEALRRGRPHGRRDRRARARRGGRPPGHPARRHRRVQAPPVPARACG